MNSPPASNPKVEPPIEIARRAFREWFLLDAERHNAEQMAWVSGFARAVEQQRRREQPMEMSDDTLRRHWRLRGGSFHGPNVETGTMPEALLLPLLREAWSGLPPPETPVRRDALWFMGCAARMDEVAAYLRSIGGCTAIDAAIDVERGARALLEIAREPERPQSPTTCGGWIDITKQQPKGEANDRLLATSGAGIDHVTTHDVQWLHGYAIAHGLPLTYTHWMPAPPPPTPTTGEG